MLRNILRWLEISVAFVMLVGFGLCGAAGVVGSVQGGYVFLLLGLAGLAIAWGCGTLIVALWRRRSSPSDA